MEWMVDTKRGAWIVVAATLLLAAALAPFLEAPALSDEVFSLEAAAKPWPEMWQFLRQDVHPPLYYLLLKAWLRLAGPGLAALRAFSLLWACVAAALAGLVLRQPAQGSGWASWFFAANGVVLMMAGYGRMYTLLAVWCLLAWIGSARWLRGEGSAWAWVAAASVAAGLCTQHFFWLFLAGLAAWAVFVHRRTAVRLAAPWAAGIMAWALLWGRTAWEQVTNRPNHLAWVPPVDFGSWALICATHVVFVAAALPVALAAMGWVRRRPVSWPSEARAAAVAAFLTLALPGLISIWKPVLNPRFTIIAAPFFAVALAPLGRATAGVLPATALAFAGIWLWWAQAGQKCTSAEAARQLAMRASAQDTVLFCRMTRKPIEYHWPTPQPQRRSFPAEIDAHPGYEGRQPEAELRREARQLAHSLTGRLFVVADSSRLPSRILLTALQEAGWRPRGAILACAVAGKHYFDRLLVFEAPPTRAGSPSAAPPAPGSPPPGPDVRAYAPR